MYNPGLDIEVVQVVVMEYISILFAVQITCAISTASSIRLISKGLNSHGREEGIVELYGNGLIQYLNGSSNEDYRNARVTCKELGYSSVASLTEGGFVGAQLEAKDYYLHQINCSGEELSITDCPVGQRLNINEFTNEGNIISLLKLSCAEFLSVKLVKGNSENEGILLVFFNNIWGYVCDDDWGQVDASVVCRQLGYNSTWSSLKKYDTQLYLPSTKIVLDDMKCAGNESDVLLCSHSLFGTSNCNNGEKVGIICQHSFEVPSQSENDVNSIGNSEARSGEEQLGNADQNTASTGNSSSKTLNIILLTAIPTIVALLFAGIIVAIFILKKKYRKRGNITNESKCTPLISLKEFDYEQ